MAVRTPYSLPAPGAADPLADPTSAPNLAPTPRGTPSAGHRTRREPAWLAAWLAPFAPGSIVLLLWLGLTHAAHLSPLLLPAPETVARSLWYGLASGTMLVGAATTLRESLTGFIIGNAVAVPLGYAVARSRWLAWAVQPYLAASQAIPAIALAPLLIVWLGYGLPPTAALAALIVFFPTTITTTLGIRSLDRDILDAARVDGAGFWTLLWRIELPLALPAILAGLRTSLTLSITGAVVGEYVLGGDGTGLGSQLTVALGSVGGTALIFAILLMLTALASLLYGIMRLLERRVSYLEVR